MAMFSLLTRRFGTGIPKLTSRIGFSIPAHTGAISATRRTFLTTARLQEPAAAKTATRATGKKGVPAAKKKPTATKRAAAKKPKAVKAAPKKRGRPVTNPKTDSGPAVPKVPKSHQPPTRPTPPFIIFHNKFMAGKSEKSKSVEETQAISKDSASLWNTLTAEEKQPFYDEHAVLKIEYEKKRADYWQNTPKSVILAINKRRQHDGKNKIHRPGSTTDPKPLPPFFRYFKEFRSSPDAAAIQAVGSGVRGDSVTIRMAAEAGKRWRELSDAEKEPYKRSFEEDTKLWRARTEQARNSA
ncbi:hypothetical protein BJ138DRAFT_1176485 [Hygrophoropsis aurantiaca]|uniref:Uncharacterized protein n=1 Tax=Hygrophoropsis aurantiaca TaxID=72124 RepID=A0ACB8AQX7_9AGAM|nr:hypothetical protein BJ138DRAFT_1176485 [Hygrophoropsis aurantiaca]